MLAPGGSTVNGPGNRGVMKLYADGSTHRARQITADVLLVVWVLVWVRVGRAVHDVTLGLATPGERIQEAGGGLAGRLRDAGSTVSAIPLVGDSVRAPFDEAGSAADRIAAAGAAQVHAVQQLAWWLGLVVAAIPVLVMLAVHLPLRWRFVREATAGQRFLDAGSGRQLDLFALRALARQPLHRLAGISDDPVGAWRAGNPDVVRELALLELRDTGLAADPGPADENAGVQGG
jgi:hypothetical protein